MSTATDVTHVEAAPTPSRSSARAARTQGAIRQAATDLFGTEGFGRVSMDELAAAAGVTKPTIYAHFGSKEALFEDLLRAALARSSSATPAPADTIEQVGDSLQQWAEDRLDWLLGPETVGLMKAAAAEGLSRPEWAQNILAEFDFGAMQRWLKDLDRAGVLRIDDPASAAGFFTALIKGTLFYPVLVAATPIVPKANRTPVIREAVRIFLAAYSPM